MKKILNLYQSYMIRPTIYKCVTKISIALAAVLLWNRFINQDNRMSIVVDGFFVAAAVFGMLAWFGYLQLDGVRFHYLFENRKEKKKPVRHTTKDIADFADEKIVSFAELEDEERLACTFVANLVSTLLFLIPAVCIFWI